MMQQHLVKSASTVPPQLRNAFIKPATAAKTPSDEECATLTKFHGLVRRLPELELEGQGLQVVTGLLVSDLGNDLRDGPEILKRHGHTRRRA